MREHAATILRSYAEVYFLGGVVPGVVILAASMIYPAVVLAGVTATVAAYVFASFIGMQKQFLASGFYTYNPLLVGLSLGCLFRITPLTLFFCATAGVFCFLVTAALASLLGAGLKLPILSLPFVVGSSVAYLASGRYASLFIERPVTMAWVSSDLGLPLWIAGFCRALGAVLFMPSVIVGVALALLIAWQSRILLLLGVGGYLLGAGIRSLMLGSSAEAFTDPTAFNFILIAMALGGVFMVPSPSGYVIAAVAVAVSTVLLDSMTVLWATQGLPVFTLPFNFVTLGCLYVLVLVGHPRVAVLIGATPEQTLENDATARARYPGQTRTLHLPFAGRWSVWQGFDGPWTHQGSWRHAYDFIIRDEQGNSHDRDGTALTDYYCYRKPVLAPVRGRVVKTVDHLPDLPVGEVDRGNNWGNLVIIEDPRGFCVELSHFAQGSLRVQPGQWVEQGAVLGLCGNSGYSPQPHVHVQVQATDRIGAGSLPFSFVSYVVGDLFHSNDLPAVGEYVEPVPVSRQVDGTMQFILDEEVQYEVIDAGGGRSEMALVCRMDLDGTFYLESGRGRLYFGKSEGTFYIYRVTGNDRRLQRLFAALPRLPLGQRTPLRWEDHVPVSMVTSGWRRVLAHLVSIARPAAATVRVRARMEGEGSIHAQVQSFLFGDLGGSDLLLEPGRGIVEVRTPEMILRQIRRDMGGTSSRPRENTHGN